MPNPPADPGTGPGTDPDVATDVGAGTGLGWTGYLDALTAAANALLDGPAGQDDAPTAQFPALEQPRTPLPAALEAHRDDVVRLLDRTTRELQRRQSAVAQELAALRPRSPRSAYRTEAGDAVDLVG